MALLQKQSTSVGAGLPSPATMLFTRPILGFMPQINRVHINIDNDDAR